jgi:hypothetical protein
MVGFPVESDALPRANNIFASKTTFLVEEVWTLR